MPLSEPSLADVFVAHRTQLWRVARQIVNTEDLADDVVQDAYLKLAEGPGRVAERPIGYCCQVVRNLAPWRILPPAAWSRSTRTRPNTTSSASIPS